MKQYAVLKNVVRDANFGIVVKSGESIKFYGWSEKAIEWANWANLNNADLNQLPANISVGEFKVLSEEILKGIIVSSQEATAAGSSTITTKTLSFKSGSERFATTSKHPSFIDGPICGDWVAKTKSVNFKAQNFKKEVTRNELTLKVRTHELAFDNNSKKFVGKPNRVASVYTRSEIQKKISHGAERKLGKQITDYVNKEIIKNYGLPTIKRDSIGKSTKQIIDTYVKASLGGTIGRAVRSGSGLARGATPNRRTRGNASRFISGVLDPGKRRDVDGDGLIFDGTWREMPDPNRGRGGTNLPNGGGGFGIRTPTKPDSGRGADRTPRSSGRPNTESFFKPPESMNIGELERLIIEEWDNYDPYINYDRYIDGDSISSRREAARVRMQPLMGEPTRRGEGRRSRGDRRERTSLTDGGSLRSSGAPREAPRAATAVQMAFDTRNSKKASKMTYDPQNGNVEVTYRDGRKRTFADLDYEDAKRAGAADAIDKLITDLETGRLGKDSNDQGMGLGSSLRSSGSETPRKNLQPLPTNVRSFIKRLKDKYSNPVRSDDSELTDSLRRRITEQEAAGLRGESSLQALFREWENGFISDRNRESALDFLRDIENQYQKQDNQSPSVTTRPISQEDRIAAAHLAKLIAMSDDDYKESSFNAIRDIDYSPIPEELKRRNEQTREFNRDFDERNPGLARRGGGALRSRGFTPGRDNGQETYSDFLDSPKGRAIINRSSEFRLRSSGGTKEKLDDFGDTPRGFRYPNASQRKRIFDSKEQVDQFERDMTDDYKARRRMIEADLGFDDGYYMDDEELIKKFMDDNDMTRGEARSAMRKYRRDYDRYEKEQEQHEQRLDELNALKSKLPFESELDDPIELDTNGFPKNEDQMERFNELNESESSPVFKARKRPTPNQSLRSSGSTNVDAEADEMADIPSLINRLKNDDVLSEDELDSLQEIADIVKSERGQSEEILDAMIDLEKEISNSRKKRKAFRREFGERQALYSRGGSAPLSQRRSTATTERAARPRGTTLRSAGSSDADARKPIPKSGTGAGPGGKSGHGKMERVYGKEKKGTDGELDKSLTPEQKEAVKKTLIEEVKPNLDKKLKTFFDLYWKARTERGSKKQSVTAVKRRAKGDARGRYEKVSADTPLESADIYEMLYRLDDQVARGLVEKFEVSDKDSRDLKLDDNGLAKISADKNGYTNQQRTLDDAQTILNMIENDDFSALEHLHPSTKKKIADAIKKNGGTVPKGWIDSDSSVAGWAGGESRTKAPDVIDLGKERGLGKKKKEKQLSLFQRLRRVDPQRERRVELRLARRTNQLREGITLDPELQLKKRVLRARAMKRTFLSKFKKSRDADKLSLDMKSKKDEVGVLKTNPSANTVEVTDAYVDLLHALDQGLIGISSKQGKSKKTDEELESEHTQLLRRLWENSGYSETPVSIKEDEVKLLLDAGWQVMVRGVGHEKVKSETYVEQFINEEGRFIPGRGMSAKGIGEYFSFPGSWQGYHGANPDDRHTIIALIPPSADVMSQSQLETEHSVLSKLTERVNSAMKVLGGRDVTKAMEPEELVAEIDKATPDLGSGRNGVTTRSEQIVKQLRDRLEALSKLPRTTDAEKASIQEQKEKILNSFDYLERFAKQRDKNMIAPLIGVDVIDTNNGDGIQEPILLHNRGILAVFQNPTTLKQAELMVNDENNRPRPKAWTKWRNKQSQIPGSSSEASKPKRTKAPRKQKPTNASVPTPAAQPTPSTSPNTAPPQSVPGSVKAPVDVSSWTSSRPQNTGSNPATLLTSPDGTQYYTKLPKGVPTDQDRMETEVLASELYKLAGIQSADVQMGNQNGKPVTLSRIIQSRNPNSQADQDEALNGYVVDAWLANWDAPLNDNIQFDNGGKAVRLDVGGSLDFRAQGAPKGNNWGNTVGEIDTMKKTGTFNYKKITDAAIKQQAKALGNVTDADIRATVARIFTDPARAKKMADTLIARRDDIVKRYGS